MIYLSNEQKNKVQGMRHNNFCRYANTLPTWVCAKEVGMALKKVTTAVDRAQVSLGNVPYMWSTEFENVHTTWIFDEPKITAPDQSVYSNSETYYHTVKSTKSISDYGNVMFGALWLKFVHSAKRVELLNLLISTSPHPLLSIKADDIYGYHPDTGGNNLLGIMLQNIREIVINKIHMDRFYKPQKIPVVVMARNAVDRIENLYSCYEAHFCHPAWAKAEYDDRVFRQNQKDVTVYTLAQLDSDFHKVWRNRIPTNLSNTNY